jgi:hypothetical protein
VALPVGTTGLLTNLLTTLTALLGWLGLRRHFGFRLPLRAAFWFAAAYFAANGVFFEYWASSAPRLALFFAAQFLLASLTLRDVLLLGEQGQQRELLLLKRFTVLELVGLLGGCAYVLGSLKTLDPLSVDLHLAGNRALAARGKSHPPGAGAARCRFARTH